MSTTEIYRVIVLIGLDSKHNIIHKGIKHESQSIWVSSCKEQRYIKTM